MTAIKQGTQEEKEIEIKQEKNVLVLKYPISIDGKKVLKLKYDFEELTGDDLDIIDRLSAQAKTGSIDFQQRGFDSVQLRYTFMQAVCKKNKEYDVLDLKRMRGKDLFEAEKLARNFMVGFADGTEK